MNRRRSASMPGLALAVFLAASVAGAAAQDFPTQPVRVVIPYAPGGGSDILMRPIAPLMAERLKQSIVIDNRAGAGGNIGAQQVAHAPPDGHTLLMANNSHTVNPYIYKDAGYDLSTQFAPISLVGTSPLIVVVHKSVPVRTLAELVALAQAAPGKLNFGSPGVGTPGHLAAVLFNKQAGVDALHIAYKGSGPTTLALLQAEVQFSFSTPAAVEPHLRSGDLRALAVTSAERFAAFPDVPTVAQSGLRGLGDYRMDIWWGLLAPARTDPRVLDKLHAAVVQAVADPSLRQRWLAQGMVPSPSSRAEFQALIKADQLKWQKVVADNRITLD